MVTWHIDDVKSSHVDHKVNDEFHMLTAIKRRVHEISS